MLVRFEEAKAQPWSMSGLAKGIKALLAAIAEELEPDDAKQLKGPARTGYGTRTGLMR